MHTETLNKPIIPALTIQATEISRVTAEEQGVTAEKTAGDSEGTAGDRGHLGAGLVGGRGHQVWPP